MQGTIQIKIPVIFRQYPKNIPAVFAISQVTAPVVLR